MVGVAAGYARAAWTMQFEVQGGPHTGGDIVTVHVFATNDVATTTRGFQTEIPCSIAAKVGGSGTATTSSVVPFGTTITTAGVTTPNGTFQWIMGNRMDGMHGGGIAAVTGALCRAIGSPSLGETPYPIVAGQKYYVATYTMTLSVNATGAFNVVPECVGAGLCPDPIVAPLATHNTKIIGPASTTDAQPIDFIDKVGKGHTIDVPTGSCCTGVACFCDGVNQETCENLLAAGRPVRCGAATSWASGQDCQSPGGICLIAATACTADGDCPGVETCSGTPNPLACQCTDDAQCPDNFCNPRHCDLLSGLCVDDPATICPDPIGSDVNCTNPRCDKAAAGGMGACVLDNKTDGTACDGKFPILNPTCDLLDTCLAGVCVNNFEAAGVSCTKDPKASGECNLPDTCNGMGGCDLNYVVGGCTPDLDPCTDDVCASGNCTHPFDASNPCDDGDFCTSGDHCVAGVPPTCEGTATFCAECTLCDPTDGLCDPVADGTPCTPDAETCTFDRCLAGVCDHPVNPACTPTVGLDLEKDKNGTNCAADDDEIRVNIFKSTSAAVAGFEASLVYDTDCLDFTPVCQVSGDPCSSDNDCGVGEKCGILNGNLPFNNHIYLLVDENAGTICLAVGTPVPPAGPKSSGDPGIIVTLVFKKIGDCNDCPNAVCLEDNNPCHTQFAEVGSKAPIVPDIDPACIKDIFGNGEMEITCPANQSVNADCNRPTAIVEWACISSDNSCGHDTQRDCSCSHVRPDGSPGIDCDYLAACGGEFPQGVYTFNCTARDETCCLGPDTGGVKPACNEDDDCSWTVTVSDEQSVDVHIQLSPVVDDGDCTRCICYEIWENCVEDPIEVCYTTEFGGDFSFPGKASDKIKVPKGKHGCMAARDYKQSLRSSDFLTCDSGTGQYVADFRGDPFFGGNWLIQGNLNGDHIIDIIDFGVFLGALNDIPQTVGPKECAVEGGDKVDQGDSQHADLNCDGVVDVRDFTFIQINFLEHDKDACCPDDAASQPAGITEISVKQLREMGLGHLAIADLNSDGLVNPQDMAAFMQGARPKAEAKGDRNNVRPGTVRGTK